MHLQYALENFWCSELYQWRDLKIGKSCTLVVAKRVPCIEKLRYARDLSVLLETLPLQASLHVLRLLSIKVQRIEVLSGTIRITFKPPSSSSGYVVFEVGSKFLKSGRSLEIETELPFPLEAVPEDEWVRNHTTQQVLNSVRMPGGWQKNGTWIPSLPSDVVLWMHQFCYRETYFHLPNLYETHREGKGRNQFPGVNHAGKDPIGWQLPAVVV